MREPVHTDAAPAAIGPYSQAIKTDRVVFCSGQIALDPASGKLLEGDVASQTKQAMLNLKAVLEASGSSLEKVLRTTIYLADMNDFAAVNEVYGGFFTGAPPARSTIQAGALPKGARVEIDAIAQL